MNDIESTMELSVISESPESALQKSNITTAIIQKLRQDAETFHIQDHNDKQGYESVKAQRLITRKVRTTAEKICEQGRESLRKHVQHWIDVQKEVTGEIKKIEDSLQRKEDVYTSYWEELQRKQLQEIADRQRLIDERNKDVARKFVPFGIHVTIEQAQAMSDLEVEQRIAELQKEKDRQEIEEQQRKQKLAEQEREIATLRAEKEKREQEEREKNDELKRLQEEKSAADEKIFKRPQVFQSLGDDAMLPATDQNGEYLSTAKPALNVEIIEPDELFNSYLEARSLLMELINLDPYTPRVDLIFIIKELQEKAQNLITREPIADKLRWRDLAVDEPEKRKQYIIHHLETRRNYVAIVDLDREVWFTNDHDSIPFKETLYRDYIPGIDTPYV